MNPTMWDNPARAGTARDSSKTASTLSSESGAMAERDEAAPPDGRPRRSSPRLPPSSPPPRSVEVSHPRHLRPDARRSIRSASSPTVVRKQGHAIAAARPSSAPRSSSSPARCSLPTVRNDGPPCRKRTRHGFDGRQAAAVDAASSLQPSAICVPPKLPPQIKKDAARLRPPPRREPGHPRPSATAESGGLVTALPPNRQPRRQRPAKLRRKAPT